MHAAQYFASFLGLLVLFGVLAQIGKNGPAANNVVTASGQFIAGLARTVQTGGQS